MNIRLALILVAAMISTASAATVDVRKFGAVPDDDRDDAPAIQSAIDSAKSGDTILFPPGTFLVAHSIDPRGGGRTLQGATTVKWQDAHVIAESQTILKATNQNFVLVFSGEDLTISHLTLAGRGIDCDRPNNVMVRKLSIDNCWFAMDVKGESEDAIEFTTGLADSRITNCVFDPIKGDNGIYGYNWSNLVIANNHFLNGNEGIHLTAHLDASKDLLIEQNYFAGLHRMGAEIQGGGNNTVVQDNFYEKPMLSDRFDDNNDTFAYSVISDRSKGSRVRRNTSIAPERPDKVGVRIIFELGGEDVICEDNYSVNGNHVAILNTSRDGRIVNNRFSGFLEAASAYEGRAINATIRNNGPDVILTWDINRGKPGPNKRFP